MKEKGEKAQSRIENLEELTNAAKQFLNQWDESFEEAFTSPLAAFLDQAALDAGDAQADVHQDSVQLMTLHSAKGLEFPLVFLAGMEEGLFPHKMSVEEPGRLEEERRLCYVGITRAMQKLHITYAESRRLHGQETFNRPSRFIREIPDEMLEEVSPQRHHLPSNVGPSGEIQPVWRWQLTVQCRSASHQPGFGSACHAPEIWRGHHHQL